MVKWNNNNTSNSVENEDQVVSLALTGTQEQVQEGDIEGESSDEVDYFVFLEHSKDEFA